ncbi:MAG: glycosyltransferase [Acidobacteriaceae bacterium]|nr:glycosyltransferase [Acidobacteriaceae bacterium]
MRIALFYHSLVSDWNHGNAHFLRGVAAELLSRGHQISIFEPENSWSRENLLRDAGPQFLDDFRAAFPALTSIQYDPAAFNADEALGGVDLILVHEWNDHRVIADIGQFRRRNSSARLFFHDTHHRALTAHDELARFDLRYYDGVLAYGASLRETYVRHGWGSQVYVWHEAADTRVFYPKAGGAQHGDVVWIGNWGDEERSDELREFFIGPVARAGLRAKAYGVRYPAYALDELSKAGVGFAGWLPNFKVPEVFAQFKATIHVPRRPYTQELPGIPTIRPFEALACGIPLVSAPWRDTERLFRVGQDFLMARDGAEMERHLKAILHDRSLAASLRANGLETIRRRHTCAHRVDELMKICGHAQRQQAPAMTLAGGAS